MVETTAETAVVRQAPYLEEFQRRLLDQAFARGETPVGIPDIPVAGLHPLTQQAITAGEGVGQFMPYLTQGAETIGTGLQTLQDRAASVPGLFRSAAEQAQGTAGLYTPTTETLQPYMDPYQQLVTQEAVAEMGRQGKLASNQLRAQQVGLGALGGERGALQLAELQRNVTEQQSRRIFEDMSRNFNQAQNAAQTAFESQQRRQQGVGQLLAGIGQATGQEAVRTGAGIGQFGGLQAGVAGQGLGLLGQQTQLQSQLGALGQTQEQREIDAARQTQMQQLYEPFQRLGYMADIFKPSIGSAGSTLGVSTAPSPSMLSSGIGLGIAGLGINQAYGNPLGVGFSNLFGGGQRP
jgi:hypothetical protein|tara:strand:- start:2111 stop:3163 length:1053 start_codon:yes stop_codon:yes gene_type:complete